MYSPLRPEKFMVMGLSCGLPIKFSQRDGNGSPVRPEFPHPALEWWPPAPQGRPANRDQCGLLQKQRGTLVFSSYTFSLRMEAAMMLRSASMSLPWSSSHANHRQFSLVSTLSLPVVFPWHTLPGWWRLLQGFCHDCSAEVLNHYLPSSSLFCVLDIGTLEGSVNGPTLHPGSRTRNPAIAFVLPLPILLHSVTQ